MLGRRIRDYLSNALRWRADHTAAWDSALMLGPDQQTPFQRECQRRVEAILRARGLDLSFTGSKVVDDPGEPGPWVLIRAEVPALGAVIWFHFDQVGISANDQWFRLEHDSVRVPNEYYEELESFLLSLRPFENAT